MRVATPKIFERLLCGCSTVPSERRWQRRPRAAPRSRGTRARRWGRRGSVRAAWRRARGARCGDIFLDDPRLGGAVQLIECQTFLPLEHRQEPPLDLTPEGLLLLVDMDMDSSPYPCQRELGTRAIPARHPAIPQGRISAHKLQARIEPGRKSIVPPLGDRFDAPK